MPPLDLVRDARRSPGGVQRLLDVAELNAGSSATIVPNATVGLPGNPVRLLDLRADSKTAQVVTVTLSQQLPTAPARIPSGPIYAILEIGNGAGTSYLEVDVPPPDTFSVAAPTYGPYTFTKSGVSLSVPAGSLRVYGRNDANAFLAGFRASNGLQKSTIGTIADPPFDPTLIAHVAYNSIYGAVAPTRSFYLARPNNTLAAGDAVNIDIPPFATALRVLAYDGTISPAVRVFVTIGDTIGLNSYTWQYDVPAGSAGRQDLPGNASLIQIRNTGANALTSLIAAFEIGNF